MVTFEKVPAMRPRRAEISFLICVLRHPVVSYYLHLIEEVRLPSARAAEDDHLERDRRALDGRSDGAAQLSQSRVKLLTRDAQTNLPHVVKVGDESAGAPAAMRWRAAHGKGTCIVSSAECALGES